MRWLKWFVAGALAVPLAHQVALAILHATGFAPRPPYAMTPTKPFGVPAVVSLSFWGGVWGPILGLVLARTRGAAYWIAAIVFGAIAPTLVAIFVVSPMKGQPSGGGAKMLATGLIVNAAWGLAAAAIYRVIGRS
jgi:hypothetical protein